MAAASAAVSTPPPTAATALCLGTSFIHHEVPATHILTVQRVDGTLGIFVVSYFDECEPARLSRETVTNQVDTRGSYTDLRKPLVELIFRSGERKIPDIKLLHLLTPSARNPPTSRGAR